MGEEWGGRLQVVEGYLILDDGTRRDRRVYINVDAMRGFE
jgi:hypothetical protein